MNKPWELPESLRVGQQLWPIRGDFCSALDCMVVLEAEDLDEAEKAEFVCRIIFPKWEEMFKQGLFQEAVKAAFDFLDGGRPKKTAEESAAEPKGRVMSWTEDSPLIFDAINKHRQVDIRREKPHWWTFLGITLKLTKACFQLCFPLDKSRGTERNWINLKKILFRKILNTSAKAEKICTWKRQPIF